MVTNNHEDMHGGELQVSMLLAAAPELVGEIEPRSRSVPDLPSSEPAEHPLASTHLARRESSENGLGHLVSFSRRPRHYRS
jgi:hypothetical protein